MAKVGRGWRTEKGRIREVKDRKGEGEGREIKESKTKQEDG